MSLLAKCADPIGILGVIIVLFSYYQLNRNKMSAKGLDYLLLNCLGSGCVLFSLAFHWNTSAFIIETAWILISIMGIINVLGANSETNT